MCTSLRRALAGCSMMCLASLAGVAHGQAMTGDDKKMDDKMMMAVDVTITNMTKGQPLSPPIIVAHDSSMHLFEKGKKASPALQKLAEEGMNGELAKMCEGKVMCVAAGMDDKIMPGQSKTYHLKCKQGDLVSIATMLAASNDGFAGLDSYKLDLHDGSDSQMLMAYDAGTEENTEKKTDTAGPDMGKGHPATSPQGDIMMHKGIMGVGDLDKMMFGWEGPVAKVEFKKAGM